MFRPSCNLPVVRNLSMTFVLIGTSVGCASLSQPGSSYGAKGEQFYIFQTKERSFDENRYGTFCSNEYATRRYLNNVMSGPYESSFACESSDLLGTLRAKRQEEAQTILKNPKFKKYKKQILAGEVVIGMPREAVLFALGEPSDVNSTQTQYSQSEQLVYPSKYIYIRGGKVVAIQNY